MTRARPNAFGGARNLPVLRKNLGSFLSDTPRQKPSRPPRAKSRAQKVREYLDANAGSWYSLKELSTTLGLTISVVNDAIYYLCLRGLAVRKLPATGRKLVGQVYRSTKGQQ